MDGVGIHEATRDDAFLLGGLQLRWDRERGAEPDPTFIHRYADAWLASGDTRPAWVAKTADGNPVGFALSARVRKLPSLLRAEVCWLHLSAVYVDPYRRGRGLGGELLQAVLDWCPAHQVTRVQLNADAGARSLYERLGFTAPDERLMELRLP